jgi:hypothetical protein
MVIPIQSLPTTDHIKSKRIVDFGLLIWTLLQKLHSLADGTRFLAEERDGDGARGHLATHRNHEDIETHLLIFITLLGRSVRDVQLSRKSLADAALPSLELIQLA